LVNFQPAGAPVPGGALVDAGAVFADRGTGHSYGWNVGNETYTRDRDAVSNQLLDTLNHMEHPDAGTPRHWEMALAPGTYTVHVVAGDPAYPNCVNSLQVEGVAVNDPDGEDELDEYTVSVSVSDGRLTIQQAPSGHWAKLCYVEVTRE
jgi:hypothetical protein